MSNFDLITQSEIQTFCDCRIKHHYSYEQLLKPRRGNLSFHLGNVVHKWLEHYYLGKSESLEEIHKQFIGEAGTFGSDETNELQETLNTLKGIVAVYRDIDPVKRYKLQVIKVEHQFHIQDPAVPRRKLSGKIDLLLKDNSGRLWILDHKTVSRIDSRFSNTFRSNRQMQIYLLACRKDPTILTLGKIGGVIPNLIRKPALRRKQTEGEDEFYTRVREDIKSRLNEYFYSEMIPYEEHFSRKTEAEVWPLVSEIRNPKKLMYRNPSHCESYLGKCAFHDICHEVPGCETLYTKKAARHEELIKVATKVPQQQAVMQAEEKASEQPKRSDPVPTEKVDSSKKVSRLETLVTNLRGKKKKGR